MSLVLQLRAQPIATDDYEFFEGERRIGRVYKLTFRGSERWYWVLYAEADHVARAGRENWMPEAGVALRKVLAAYRQQRRRNGNPYRLPMPPTPPQPRAHKHPAVAWMMGRIAGAPAKYIGSAYARLVSRWQSLVEEFGSKIRKRRRRVMRRTRQPA